MTTQTAVVHYALEPLAVELREIPIPQIGDGEVLLEVERSRFSHPTSTSHAIPIRGRSTSRSSSGMSSAAPWPASAAASPPSAKAIASSAKPPPRSAARACYAARAVTTVPARKGFGYGVNGAMAQFVKVPARCLHHIPDSLPFDIACLAEPHSVAYQVMCVNSRIAPGDFVVVIGPAPSACCAHEWPRCRAPARSSSPA